MKRTRFLPLVGLFLMGVLGACSSEESNSQGTAAGSGTAASPGAGAQTGTGAQTGAGAALGTAASTGSGAETGAAASTGAGAATGTAASTGAGAETGAGADAGVLTGAGGSGATGAWDGGFVDMDACTAIDSQANPVPVVLEFVVDVSGTMQSDAANTDGRSKYEVTRDALIEAIADLPASIAVGLSFYPNMDNGGIIPDPEVDHDECIDTSDNVAIATLGEAGSTQRSALENALMAVTPEPDGATPTHDAFNIAVEALNATNIVGDKYVVILTDGQPTLREGCIGNADPYNPEDYTPIVTAIGAAAAEQGIRTFIIGSPGSEENRGNGEDVRYQLSEQARAGGTGPAGCSDTGEPFFCHFDMTESTSFALALADALGQIGTAVLSCVYTVPPAPDAYTIVDVNDVTVLYTPAGGQPVAIPPAPAGTCTDGWQYSEDQTQLLFCTNTCDMLMADPNAAIRIQWNCVLPQ